MPGDRGVATRPARRGMTPLIRARIALEGYCERARRCEEEESYRRIAGAAGCVVHVSPAGVAEHHEG